MRSAAAVRATLVLVFSAALAQGCSKSSSGGGGGGDNSGDGLPANPTNPQSAMQSGFKVLTPKFAGLVDATGDTTTATPAAKICDNKDPGTFVIRNGSDEITMSVCVGTLKSAASPYFSYDFYDTDDVIATAFKAKTLTVYSAVYTDTVKNVTDVSSILLFDTGTTLEPRCESTDFSNDTLRSAFSGETVDKSNANQMTSLVSGRGVCDNAHLYNVQDITKVQITAYDDTADGQITEGLVLTKVYP